jgi:hypothetical protein
MNEAAFIDRSISADSYGVQVWDLHDGRLIGQFETNRPVRAVALTHDGRYALSAGENSGVNLWPMPSP